MKERLISSRVAVCLMMVTLFSACSDGIIGNYSQRNDGPSCGNGIVDTGETCDTAIAAGQTGACPTYCDDADLCTVDTLQNVDTCTAACAHASITTCANDDGCCPAGCNEDNDNNCAVTAICGDGVVEVGESCDTGIVAGQPGACPQTCDDSNTCTNDILQNGGTCTAACAHTAITAATVPPLDGPTQLMAPIERIAPIAQSSGLGTLR